MNLVKNMAVLGILLSTAVAGAQQAKPATLTIHQAEELFFKNNFLLLAQQYNIDKAGAQVVQAKLYPNPEISADIIGYQGQDNVYFPSGQKKQSCCRIGAAYPIGR